MTPRVASTEIDIDAPIDRVWQIVADLPRYHEWNPFIVGVTGLTREPAIDQKFRLRVRWRTGRETTSAERFTNITPPTNGPATLEYRFDAWLHHAGLVRATRIQTLHKLSDNKTRYATEERFTGLLVRLIPLAAVQDGFERHALALKTRAER